jgi:hypothetical protein
MLLDVMRDKNVKLVASKAALEGHVEFVLVQKNLQKQNDGSKAEDIV